MYDADCLEKIGANVKFLRTMRKLRQQDVAQTLGISQTHLSNMESVSYTHLRAHETRHDLVCRLLLEKKKRKAHERKQ